VDYVVYDTNIASLAVKGELPAGLAARLPGAVPVLSFVTVGELEKWAEVRAWGVRSRGALDRWISRRPGNRKVETMRNYDPALGGLDGHRAYLG
jgi:hypothetical protein